MPDGHELNNLMVKYPRLKPDWKSISQSVSRRNIRRIYHFTSLDNVPGIINEGGILSRFLLDKKGIIYKQHRWGNIAKMNGLKDYVCTSLVPNRQMIWNEVLPMAVIEVGTRVLQYENTLFCNTNCANRNLKLQEILNSYKAEDFDKIFLNSTAVYPRDRQAEILVKDKIDLKDILKICFANETYMEKIIERCEYIRGMEMAVEPEYFVSKFV